MEEYGGNTSITLAEGYGDRNTVTGSVFTSINTGYKGRVAYFEAMEGV